MNPITLNGCSYANNNPMMNVDLDDEFSRRTDFIIRGIDTLLKAILVITGICALFKFRKSASKFYRMLNGKKFRPVFEAGTRKFLTRFGINKAIALSVATLAIGILEGNYKWKVFYC
ncbi:hypothetical protein ACIQ57_11435 [Lysinibacillus xylanilyticus]|uniref:hypothetical protein n=1 Tax=Lysinibacillus xylanilyticus TaxID=582475 RepID=UPI0037F9199B